MLHLLAIILLTVLTQIGGLVYVLCLLLVKKSQKRSALKRLGWFAGLYLLATFLIVPYLAPLFGREKIQESEQLRAQSFFYQIANRNYVRPELNQSLKDIAQEFENRNSDIVLVYLDANFPFIDGFPLLPHLSHNDGKKVDVSLMYQNPDGTPTNKKPSRSGYGVYEGPRPNEHDQPYACKAQGFWQYDFPKHLTFGRINPEIEFSAKGTKELTELILKRPNIGKLFIEPHLKNRLQLNHSKVRFHGCYAVRHDDHIHFQLQ